MKKNRKVWFLAVLGLCLFSGSKLANAEDLVKYSTGVISDPTPVIEQPVISHQLYRSNSLPAQFDPRIEGDTPVKSQNPRNICWAFSSIGSIETGVLKKEKVSYDFSELYTDYYFAKDAFGNDLENSHSYGRKLNSGGQEFYPIYAAINWKQPILEEKMPYQSAIEIPFLNPEQLNEESAVHVQGMVSIPKLEKKYTNQERLAKVNVIKKQIYSDSGVTYQWCHSYLNDSKYYNDKNATYFVPQSDDNEGIGHSSLIVGWDDNYAKEKFNSLPDEDGAFIVRNSWGTTWADGGYYYVSYEDYYIATSSIYGVSQVESKTNYDNNYTHAEFYSYYPRQVFTNSVILSNVYETKKQNEKLKAISFHTTQYNTPYEIYLSLNTDDFKNTKNLNDMIKVGSGVKEIPGIETISLDNEVKLDGVDKFAVIVKLKKPEGVDNLYILTENKYYDKERYKNVVTNKGETYLALTNEGKDESLNFVDLATVENSSWRNYAGNAYINAYTIEDIPVSTVELNPKSLALNIGETKELKATILPENSKNKAVRWESSDSSVATVDKNGKVTGIWNGKATIKVTSEDSGKTAEAIVTVSKEDDHGNNSSSTTLGDLDSDLAGVINYKGDLDYFEVTIKPREKFIVVESTTGYSSALGYRVNNGNLNGYAKIVSKEQINGKYYTVYSTVDTYSKGDSVALRIDKDILEEEATGSYSFKVHSVGENFVQAITPTYLQTINVGEQLKPVVEFNSNLLENAIYEVDESTKDIISVSEDGTITGLKVGLGKMKIINPVTKSERIYSISVEEDKHFNHEKLGTAINVKEEQTGKIDYAGDLDYFEVTIKPREKFIVVESTTGYSSALGYRVNNGNLNGYAKIVSKEQINGKYYTVYSTVDTYAKGDSVALRIDKDIIEGEATGSYSFKVHSVSENFVQKSSLNNLSKIAVGEQLKPVIEFNSNMLEHAIYEADESTKDIITVSEDGTITGLKTGQGKFKITSPVTKNYKVYTIVVE